LRIYKDVKRINIQQLPLRERKIIVEIFRERSRCETPRPTLVRFQRSLLPMWKQSFIELKGRNLNRGS
jgi:hypothetical protein